MKIRNFIAIVLFIGIFFVHRTRTKPINLSDLFATYGPSAAVKYLKASVLSDILSNDPVNEHGHLDSIARKILNKFAKEASNVGGTIARGLSIGSTQGLDTNKTFTGVLDFMNKLKLIFPGTLFCGQDNIADNSEELGLFSTTDSCCRDHDHCQQGIPAAEKKYGLSNTGLFTRSHCECDKKFYNCLKDTNSIVSRKIGFTFFSILGPQCFKLDYPQIGCSERSWGRCVKYIFDENQEKKVQWFDNPVFMVNF